MKCLFVFMGESFRTGGQNSRLRDAPESFYNQKKACESHVKLLKHIEGSECFINTYETIYKKQLLDWYEGFLIGSTFHDTLIGMKGLYEDSLEKLNFEKYDFVYYIRIDLYLKDFFFDCLKFEEKIIYSFICFIPYHEYENKPRVADLLVCVPKCFYDKVFSQKINILCHEGWYNLEKNGLETSDIDCILKTYHDSDSAKDWNPLYTIVNRDESKSWKSKGYEYDKITLKPIKKDCQYKEKCEFILGYKFTD